mmetsp:Transcript_13857/g.30183  ORF Transcript_13857/g.30183 Transcript_13857/m.30183 type:complete len:452 (+) Transcript_13857:395-1750(+)
MNSILFPVPHVHVSVGEVTFALSLPLSTNIIARVNIPIVETTRSLSMKSIFRPLARILSAIMKANSPPSLNKPILKSPHILISIGPFQFSIPMSLPPHVIFPLIRTRRHVAPTRYHGPGLDHRRIDNAIEIVSIGRISPPRLPRGILEQLLLHLLRQCRKCIGIVPRRNIDAVRPDGTELVDTLAFLLPLPAFFFQHLLAYVLGQTGQRFGIVSREIQVFVLALLCRLFHYLFIHGRRRSSYFFVHNIFLHFIVELFVVFGVYITIGQECRGGHGKSAISCWFPSTTRRNNCSNLLIGSISIGLLLFPTRLLEDFLPNMIREGCQGFRVNVRCRRYSCIAASIITRINFSLACITVRSRPLLNNLLLHLGREFVEYLWTHPRRTRHFLSVGRFQTCHVDCRSLQLQLANIRIGNGWLGSGLSIIVRIIVFSFHKELYVHTAVVMASQAICQ